VYSSYVRVNAKEANKRDGFYFDFKKV